MKAIVGKINTLRKTIEYKIKDKVVYKVVEKVDKIVPEKYRNKLHFRWSDLSIRLKLLLLACCFLFLGFILLRSYSTF